MAPEWSYSATTSAEETVMNASKLPCGWDEVDFEDAGPGMLVSSGFWIGGVMSAGFWSLLLLAVHG